MYFSLYIMALAAFASSSKAAYVLQDDYSANNFFDMFEFFTAPDPTQGFVNYVDQATAQAGGLISTNGNGQVTLSVDSHNIAPNGRSSVRLTSNSVYNHGLIILDLAHMPVGCGTWPAFWTVGPNWPAEGEIDIIEGVNNQETNAMTLHTNAGCGITNNNNFTGSIATPNCDVAAPGQPGNAGCSIDAPKSNTFGAGFNAAGGGVYATEWTSQAISIYFFPSGSIPNDITSGNPDPLSWGQPVAQFQGGCDLDSYFKNQQIVFDMTFCGDWAGAVWSSSSCAQDSWSCSDFVANNPNAFADTYWEINSLRVYQDNGQGFVTPPASTSAGPTGIETGLSPSLTSLAPIPASSTTLRTSTSVAILTGVSNLPAPGALAQATSNYAPSAAATSTSQYIAPTSTSQYVAPTSTGLPSSQAPAPSTTVAPVPTTAEPEPYFSSDTPVPESWFEPGSGIPINEWGAFDKREEEKRSVTAFLLDERQPPSKKLTHERHHMRHAKMAGRRHHRHHIA